MTVEEISQIAEQILGTSSRIVFSNEKLNTFINSINFKKLLKLNKFLRFPLKFESSRDEINFLMTYAFLQIDSTYFEGVEKITKTKVFELLLTGILGIHLTGQKFTGGYFRSLSKNHITTSFRIPSIVWTSKEVPGLPVATEEVASPSEAAPFISELENLLNDAGLSLQKLGMKDFAEVLGLPFSSSTSSSSHLISSLTFDSIYSLVEYLCLKIPSFSDKPLHYVDPAKIPGEECLNQDGLRNEKKVDEKEKKKEKEKDDDDEKEEEDEKERKKEKEKIKKDENEKLEVKIIQNRRRAQLAISYVLNRFPSLFPSLDKKDSPSPFSPSSLFNSFFYIPTHIFTQFLLKNKILDYSPTATTGSERSLYLSHLTFCSIAVMNKMLGGIQNIIGQIDFEKEKKKKKKEKKVVKIVMRKFKKKMLNLLM